MEELDVMHWGKLIRLYAEKVSVVQHNMITLVQFWRAFVGSECGSSTKAICPKSYDEVKRHFSWCKKIKTCNENFHHTYHGK